MAIFDYKTGDFFWVLTQTCPPTEVTAIFYLRKFLGGEKLLDKCQWNNFKRPERGLKLFSHVSDRFSDLFSRCSNHFRVSFLFFGAISVCRRAALRKKQVRQAATARGGCCAPVLAMPQVGPDSLPNSCAKLLPRHGRLEPSVAESWGTPSSMGRFGGHEQQHAF